MGSQFLLNKLILFLKVNEEIINDNNYFAKYFSKNKNYSIFFYLNSIFFKI